MTRLFVRIVMAPVIAAMWLVFLGFLVALPFEVMARRWRRRREQREASCN